MAVASPAVKSPRGQYRCTVLHNVPLCREHYRLVLSLPRFAPTEPGQFIQVSCRDPAEPDATEAIETEWASDNSRPALGVCSEFAGPVAVLRRPFSLAGRRDLASHVELDLIHRVVGIGTTWLARLRPGDGVDILGPLGNRFTLPAVEGLAVLVGGGVGIPPMLYLAEALARAGRRGVAFCGAVTRDLLPLTLQPPPVRPSPDDFEPTPQVSEFWRNRIPALITTDDGSYGFRGYVTQALERYLARQPKPRGAVVYTCGPEPMMKRVADIAAAADVECQVAVERAMACGMGTCQSCCIRVRKPDPARPPLAGRDWCYRLACTDGPVFRGADLLW